MNQNASIDDPKYDPASYDLVIVGTPIWNSRIKSYENIPQSE